MLSLTQDILFKHFGEEGFFALSKQALKETRDFELKISAFSEKRKHEYLIGRKALLLLKEKANFKEPISDLSFPHPRIALSHCRGLALALCLKNKNAMGCGVDIELNSRGRMSERQMRFFYSNSDLKQNPNNIKNPKYRLAIWCIKEALFKSCLENKDLVMSSFDILEFIEDKYISGTARLNINSQTFKFLCIKTSTHTIAISKAEL